MIIRGKFNEILTDEKNIHPKALISGWTFIGKNVKLGKVHLANYVEINSDCVVGDNTNIQSKTVLNSGTKIGNDCLLSDHVSTADERYPTPITEEINRTPCQIGNNVVIGANATLVCCKIGDNSIIGAGSVVLDNVPCDQVWGGNPAKFISSRETFDRKQMRELK